MRHNAISRLSIIVIFAATSYPTVLADESLDLRAVQSFESHPRLKREGNRLTIQVEADTYNSVLIPRVYASLKRVGWAGTNASETLLVQPETDHWAIRWKDAPSGVAAIELLFDTPPELANEINPIVQHGDGRLNLHAYQATTTGEKLRFEPQPHKNTVGYWVNAEDFATWTIQVDQPGKFNVGILQGCGPNQGGSVATFSIHNDTNTVDQIEFMVEETGHFQNFIWRTPGTINIPQAGRYTVRLQPKKINKAALMDIRQIQLVRLP